MPRSVKHGGKKLHHYRYMRNANNAKRKAMKRKQSAKIACPEVLAAWNEKKTLKQNLATMGLAYDANAIIGKSNKTRYEQMEVDEMPIGSVSSIASVATQQKSRVQPQRTKAKKEPVAPTTSAAKPVPTGKQSKKQASTRAINEEEPMDVSETVMTKKANEPEKVNVMKKTPAVAVVESERVHSEKAKDVPVEEDAKKKKKTEKVVETVPEKVNVPKKTPAVVESEENVVDQHHGHIEKAKEVPIHEGAKKNKTEKVPETVPEKVNVTKTQTVAVESERSNVDNDRPHLEETKEVPVHEGKKKKKDEKKDETMPSNGTTSDRKKKTTDVNENLTETLQKRSHIISSFEPIKLVSSEANTHRPVVEAMEQAAAAEAARQKRERLYRLLPRDIEFCSTMIDEHGDDYAAMCRDAKNVYQETENQIARKMRIFRESPHWDAYLQARGRAN